MQTDLFSIAAMKRAEDRPPTSRVVDGFTLESGVPLESDKQARTRERWERPKFPFASMRVGESFTQRPLPGMTLLETANLVSGAACSYRKKQPPGSCNFATRQIGGTFVRCWRIE